MESPGLQTNGGANQSRDELPAQPQLGQSTATSANSLSISADEIALYDRQIRLWGVQAQEKIRTANILLIGMKGLANEVAKNIVLAGIGSLTIVDDGLVAEEDLGAQFLVRAEHIGTNRAQAALPELQKLNPRVKIQIASLALLFQDPSIFGRFTLVMATDMSFADSSTINAACRLQNRPFYAAATYGLYGYIFADLISHEFVISRAKSNVPTKLGPESATRTIVASSSSKGSDGKLTELVTKQEVYTPILLANTSPLPAFHLANRRRKANVTPLLSCLRALWDFQSQTNRAILSNSREDITLFTTLATTKHKELQLPTETLKADVLRSFLQNLGSEISPVCAFLGGQLAQDVINVIGKKEQPIQNILVFDGEETKGSVYALHSEMMLPRGNSAPMEPMSGILPVQNGITLNPAVGVSSMMPHAADLAQPPL